MLRQYFISLRFSSSKSNAIDWKKLTFKTKVPQAVVKSQFAENTNRIKITEDEMNLLERLSLVDLDRKYRTGRKIKIFNLIQLCYFREAVKVLEDSIEFASKIHNIDTTNVEPLYTVLEQHPLELREDIVTEGNIKDDIMRNAKKIEDETYFIAPVGNVALK